MSAPLPHVAAKVRTGARLRVVILGLSTADRPWSGQMQDTLAQAWPDLAIEVSEGGDSGQTTETMVASLYHDAIEEDADLVIWQTGTNDALSRTDPGAFRAHLDRGIRWLAEAGIDVILMDPHYYPGLRAEPVYARYVDAMGEIAAERGVALFPRHELMRDWAMRRPPPFPVEEHPFETEAGQACIAAMVSDLVVRSVMSVP